MEKQFNYVTRLDIKFDHLQRIDIPQMVAACKDKWFNQTLTQVNDSVIRLGIVEGEYHWHKHDNDDEFFFVLDGQLLIELENGTIELNANQGVTVSRGGYASHTGTEKNRYANGRDQGNSTYRRLNLTTMKAKKILRTLIILVVLGSNVSCDQITKNIVREKIGHYEQIGFLNNYLTLTRVENAGAFLSIGDSLPQPLKMLLLTLLPIILLGACLLYVLTKIDLSGLNMLGICFIVGGGAGNIYDRAVYGSVTDFMHIDFVLFQTGIFNMADLSVMVGAVLILLDAYCMRRRLNSKTIDT